MRFKIGNKLVLINDAHMAARKGAVAICHGYIDGNIVVTWIRNNLDHQQMDGQYDEFIFDHYNFNKEIKVFGIVKWTKQMYK